jgi:hypothetical protein
VIKILGKKIKMKKKKKYKLKNYLMDMKIILMEISMLF